jgi:hypothetical protein
VYLFLPILALTIKHNGMKKNFNLSFVVYALTPFSQAQRFKIQHAKRMGLKMNLSPDGYYNGITMNLQSGTKLSIRF